MPIGRVRTRLYRHRGIGIRAIDELVKGEETRKDLVTIVSVCSVHSPLWVPTPALSNPSAAQPTPAPAQLDRGFFSPHLFFRVITGTYSRGCRRTTC